MRHFAFKVFAKLAKSLEHTEAQVVRMLADHKALVTEQQAVDRANTKVGTQVWGTVAGQGLGRAGRSIRRAVWLVFTLAEQSAQQLPLSTH